MPFMTRLLLASSHPEDAHSRPFGPLQEKASMDRYLVHWKRFLCYYLNVFSLDEAAVLGKHGFNFTAGQRSSLERWWEHLQGEDWPEEDLREEVFQVSASFWMQHLGGDPFESPLWRFVAVLGIDSESRQLRPARLFTYVLAGMVYVGRALLAEYAVPTRERRGMDDLKERFCRGPERVAVIARQTGNRLMVSWSKQGGLVYFMGKPFPMDAIRGMVKETIKDAEGVLWDKLMFKEGDEVRFTIPLANIEGDLAQTQRRRSFVHKQQAGRKGGGDVKDLFEELSVLVTQMSWGAPARGNELGCLRLVNRINCDRNAFVIDGEIVLVTQYHKSLTRFDSPKATHRPLGGGPLGSYGKMNQRATSYGMMKTAMGGDEDIEGDGEVGPITTWGIRLTLRDWRQIAIAISKKHARQRGAAKPDFDEDAEDNEAERYQVPDDQAAAHTAATSANYGVTADLLKRLTADSLEQEEAVHLVAARETPLVAILPTGGGKSLIFMVPAMLSGAGHWPQARNSWPRVVIVSAESALGDDFMQWAADLRVRGRLNRVVIDECHLMFTAACEYRKKLRDPVRLRTLGCSFVFLTGTLPPLNQRDFEEAVQLQNPLYIRASSHHISTRYSVVNVRNGRGLMEATRLVEAKTRLLAPGDKGVVYCASRAKCKALARLTGCHYYHGEPNEPDAHFVAQREAGFQTWLRDDKPIIVATAALGTGIDVPGITHVVHLEAPHSIINYAQGAGRAGRAGELVEAVIVVVEKDWPFEDPKADAQVELKTREVRSLIQTSGCQRRILGQCLDDTRDCKVLAPCCVTTIVSKTWSGRASSPAKASPRQPRAEGGTWPTPMILV
ncbi:hypothetical protein DL767_009320 [Monosporascus sp. MG133]|nr:hypothetical protein DL767_009320 [Monosporascus sp. MG133]